jgi:hypothetical protein
VATTVKLDLLTASVQLQAATKSAIGASNPNNAAKVSRTKGPQLLLLLLLLR